MSPSTAAQERRKRCRRRAHLTPNTTRTGVERALYGKCSADHLAWYYDLYGHGLYSNTSIGKPEYFIQEVCNAFECIRASDPHFHGPPDCAANGGNCSGVTLYRDEVARLSFGVQCSGNGPGKLADLLYLDYSVTVRDAIITKVGGKNHMPLGLCGVDPTRCGGTQPEGPGWEKRPSGWFNKQLKKSGWAA